MSHFLARAACGAAVSLIVARAAADNCLSIVNTLPGTFIDITSTGTILPLSGELVAPVTTTVSNLVFPAGTLQVGNNGGIGFGITNPADAVLPPLNAALPSSTGFNGNQSLMGFWDDIGNTIGHVYAQETSGMEIVEWYNKPFDTFGPAVETITFEIQIFRDAVCGDVLAQFLYETIDGTRAGGGASATIGYQDGGVGYNDVQWSFDTAGAVANGSVLSLVCCDSPEPSGLLAMSVVAAISFRRRP